MVYRVLMFKAKRNRIIFNYLHFVDIIYLFEKHVNIFLLYTETKQMF